MIDPSVSGAQKLHKTLKDTFQTVSELYAKGNKSEDMLTKRKNDDLKSTCSGMSFSTSGISLSNA